MDQNLTAPLVSIIMPIYNCESYLAEAIESILGQTLTNFEFIIIDDGSTDSTPGILGNYNDHRIRFEKKATNIGLIACLNFGLNIAKGKYIARMDGDDISHPQRLEKQVDFLLKNNNVIVCGTAYQLLNTNEVIRHPASSAEIKLAIFEYCAIGHPTVMFNSNIVKKLNIKYNNEFEAAEDYDLWSRIAFDGDFANLPEVLLFYRNHPEQVSNKKQQLQWANSLIIRKRLFGRCCETATPSDDYFSEITSTNIAVDNLQQLKNLLKWLKQIQRLNRLSIKKDLWESYINKKKSTSIEHFYIHAPKYNMDMLKHFLKFSLKYKINFSKKQNIKIAIKCFLAWKKKQ